MDSIGSTFSLMACFRVRTSCMYLDGIDFGFVEKCGQYLRSTPSQAEQATHAVCQASYGPKPTPPTVNPRPYHDRSSLLFLSAENETRLT